MRVTKDMLDEELRGRYWVGELIGAAVAHEPTSRLISRLGASAAFAGEVWQGMQQGPAPTCRSVQTARPLVDSTARPRAV